MTQHSSYSETLSKYTIQLREPIYLVDQIRRNHASKMFKQWRNA